MYARWNIWARPRRANPNQLPRPLIISKRAVMACRAVCPLPPDCRNAFRQVHRARPVVASTEVRGMELYLREYVAYKGRLYLWSQQTRNSSSYFELQVLDTSCTHCAMIALTSVAFGLLASLSSA